MKKIVFTQKAMSKITSARRIISQDKIINIIEDYMIMYPAEQNKTAIPFIRNNTECYILVSIEEKRIVVVTVSCSAVYKKIVKH